MKHYYRIGIHCTNILSWKLVSYVSHKSQSSIADYHGTCRNFWYMDLQNMMFTIGLYCFFTEFFLILSSTCFMIIYSRYVVSFLLDSTIGLFVIYLGLKFTQVIVNKCNCETLKFGEYGKKYYISYIHECLKVHFYLFGIHHTQDIKKLHCFYRYNEVWSLAVISFFLLLDLSS